MKNPDVVAVVSGGMDSAVMVAQLLANNATVQAVTFDYGQRHGVEMDYAMGLMRSWDVPCMPIDLSGVAPLLFHGAESSQVNDVPVPHGHYAAESMKTTVVPNRNMIMLAMSGAVAISQKAKFVAYGAHQGDHAIYPDCRDSFIGHMRLALAEADWHSVELLVPFENMTKADIVRVGAKLDVPFELTWSCYEGMDLHCGKCGTCVERREAFELAGVEDPTEYAE